MFSEKAYKTYKLYIAAKLHYTTDGYDVSKTKGKVRGSRKAFMERNDQPLFLKFANRFDNDQELVQCLIANFAYGHADVIYNDSEAERNYKVWVKRKQSITEVFRNDISTVSHHALKNKLDKNALFRFNSGMYPELLKLFLGNSITLETMCIIERLDPYIDSWTKHMSFLWESERRRIVKSIPFVKYSQPKVEPIYRNFVNEL
jgi:hypothetical protein